MSSSINDATQYLQQFFKRAPVGIVVYRGERFVVDLVNDRVLEMWGKQLADVKNKPLQEIFPELISEEYLRNLFNESIDKFNRGESHVVNEVPLVFERDGKPRTGYYSYIHEPFFDASGKVSGIVAVAIEVTEQILAREQADANAGQLRLITDAMPSLISYINKDLEYVFINKAYEKWFGHPIDEVKGRKMIDVLGEAAYGRIKSYIEKTLAGEVTSYVDWLAYKDGGQRFVSASYIPHFDSNNNVVGLYALVNDLTDRKHHEEKLRQSEERLRLASQTLEEKVRERTSELLSVNTHLENKNIELANTQSFLQQLIDSSIEYVSVLDRDLRFIKVNKSYEQTLGIPRDQIEGKHLFDVNPAAKGSMQLKCITKAFMGEVVHLKSQPALARNDLFVETYFVPLMKAGTLDGVIIMSRDVTSIVRSERSLEKLNKQLSEVHRIAKLGSWEFDLVANKFQWSDEMFGIYGYEEKFEITLDRALERMPQYSLDDARTRMTKNIVSAENGYWTTGQLLYEIEPFEYEINLPDGHSKILRSAGKVEVSVQGKAVRIFGTVQDVTEIRATEEKLREVVAILGEQNAALENSNKEMESFNYVASHDLQEPLRKIQTYIDMIKRKEPGDSSNDLYLGKIDQSARRMSDLIKSMLMYSRISNTGLLMESVDLNTIIENVKTDFELTIAEREATLTCQQLPVIKGSSYQMNQLFSNFISNSLKFCKREPIIVIESQEVPGKSLAFEGVDASRTYAKISIADNGIGFDPVYKQHIFQMFHRLHTQHEFSGTGIGLSIAKKIVERHKGFIDVVTQEDVGTTFIIFLPL